MALNDQTLTTAYVDLHRAFPEDLHIARPLIHIFKDAGKLDEARGLALGMARRMLARGRSGNAIGFLEMCRNLEHPDRDEIEALTSMARLTTDGPADIEGGGQSFALIDQLSDHEAMDFIRQAQLLPVAAGTDVVRQGEVSRNFYLILEGQMRVHMHAESGRSIALNTLVPGHFFGEFACVYRLPRTANVTAVGDALLLEFSDASIGELMQRSPIAGESLMQAVQWRLIHAMTHSHPAFSELPEADRQWLAEESALAEFRDGEPVSLQKALADHACVIVHGAIDAHGPDGDRHLATGAMFGDIVGDLQLAEGTTLTAAGRCLVCAIPRHVFQSFMNAYGGFEQWIQARAEARNR